MNDVSMYLIYNLLFISHIRYSSLYWKRASNSRFTEVNVLINRSHKYSLRKILEN